MPGKKITFATVRKIGLALPGTEEATTYGKPALKVHGTPHYLPYPCVVVRLHRIREDALRDLLLMAWRFVSSGGRQAVRKRRASQSRNRQPTRPN